MEILEPTAPRLYSISSSPEAHPGEIHLTVALDIYWVNTEQKHGLCSNHLSQLAPGQNIDFYIHHNSQFKLPEPDKDAFAIGPGTGIAPSRAFLADRDRTGATGGIGRFSAISIFRPTSFISPRSRIGPGPEY